MAATYELPIRRAKLRRPQLPSGLVPRPHLTTRLDQSLRAPLTLVSAPAGFGKTTLLTDWTAHQPTPVAWLTLDAGDRDLRRFVAECLAAIETLVPGIGAPVYEVLRRLDLVPAAELGASLADALLDLPHDVVLVLDDYHLAASGEVERFLGALLQNPASLFHLVLATRSDPALPLARMRLREHVIEVRAADLRFRDEEARELLITLGYGEGDAALVGALQEQTGGWIAGLRLATLARSSVAELTRIGDGEHHLMEFLVQEVLASQAATTQDFLLRTAIVDRITAPLADALSAEPPPEGSRALLAQLVRDNLFLELDGDGEWFRYQPLFHALLRHQLQLRLLRDEIAALHLRASAWFVEQGQIDPAIRHRIAGGDVVGAACLVEQHAHTVLAREDWNTLDGWLRLLPEPIVHSQPSLVLAKGWVSHFSGRSIPISAMSVELDALLARMDVDAAEIAAWEAERDILSMTTLVWIDHDPESVLALARRAAEHIPAHRRIVAGFASSWIGTALHAMGRTDEAIRWLAAEIERGEERVDAGTIRAQGGLMFLYRRAGNVRACQELTQHRLAFLQRYDFPVATGWARWMLGWIAYERNELATATEHFSAIAADHRRVHFHTACEAMFGLALIFHAQQKLVEAAGTLRRLQEFILDANALEYLPLLRGFEARLALQQGAPERAIAWLQSEPGIGIASSGLDCYDHPYLTRIKVLLAEGSEASLARAWQDLVAFQEHTGLLHHQIHAVEVLTLEALLLAARGETETGLRALTRAVALAEAVGFVRTFVDLSPRVAPLLHRLVDAGATTPFLHHLLWAIDAETARDALATGLARAPDPDEHVRTILTTRELQVMECLARDLSYQEIGTELFIAPETVKTHAAHIYSKLGVGNRRLAVIKAQSLGWVALTRT